MMQHRDPNFKHMGSAFKTIASRLTDFEKEGGNISALTTSAAK